MFVLLKNIFRKSVFLKKTYSFLIKKYFELIYRVSQIWASKYFYKKATGKRLNLARPVNFNEKLQWLKIYWQNPLVVRCADKYDLRSYVQEVGCAEILNDLYAVYENVDEINWGALPKKFVLKTTNACATNIICLDKEFFNFNDAVNKLSKWLLINYSLVAGEWQYEKMKPRIICEKYIETVDGLMPNDYKIYCFNGVAKLILVATDRASQLKLNFMDLNWERLDIGAEEYNKGDVPQKPDCLDDMIKYAEILSKPFPFVRVDFYNCDGKPILGEMTFTPAACSAAYYNDHGLQFLGDLLKLPEKYFR